MTTIKPIVRFFSLVLVMIFLLTLTLADVQKAQARANAGFLPGCFYDSPPPPPADLAEGESQLAEAAPSAPYIQQAYMKSSNPDASDWFGDALAISGDTLVVGARREASKAKGVNGMQADNSMPLAGAVYVFVRSGGVWSQQAYLKAFSSDASDEFGKSVAISGDTIVVGAPGEDSNATGINGNYYNDAAQDAGAVYVFTRSAGVWSQQAYIKASNAQAGDGFGDALAFSGDTLVVGAPFEASSATGIGGNQADNSALNSGAAYVFTRSSSTWSQQSYIKASNSEQGDLFGVSVGLAGNTAVVGALAEDSNATGVNGNQADNSYNASGAAYAFVRNGSTWTQQAYIKASNTYNDNNFGFSVAIYGNTIVAGAPSYPNSDATSGAAYVYTRTNGTWSHQAFLRSTDIDYNDDFDVAVAIAGDRIIVGAQHECSESTGVNGEPYHWDAPESGAAYTFVRSTDNIWRQEAYIKASNTGPQDEFGRAVAIIGNTVIVGAHGEDSPAKGINHGDQADNSSVDAGAVYIFTGIPTMIASQLDDLSPTAAAQVDFKVTFSEPVTGVDRSDFATVTSSGVTGAHVTGVSGGPTSYIVTVNTGSGDGTLRLDLNDDDSIIGERNVPLGGAGIGNASFTNGETYLVRLRKQIFRSQAASDGWILESGEKTTLGGTLNTSGSLIVGDDDLNKQYRSVVSFDTSSLPDTAKIVFGTFKLRKESVVGTDPFTTHSALQVALCKGFFGATSGLQIDDFEFYRLTYCSSARPEYHVNGGVWYDIVQGTVERPRINRMGLTQYRLEFAYGDDNDETADYVTFYSADASTVSYRPALVVEYYMP